jgi:hypothetical protein
VSHAFFNELDFLMHIESTQFHTVVAVAARRTEFSGEPRLANAAKYLFSSYATRSCQQRNTMRIHLKAKARTLPGFEVISGVQESLSLL